MIKQLIPQEYCMKCQGCCRFNSSDTVWSPSLAQEDKARLAHNKVPSFFLSDENKIRLIFNQQLAQFLCSFFTLQDNACRVYNFRPVECQMYPFVFNRDGKKVFLAVDEKCAFIKDNAADPSFEEYTKYLTDFVQTPNVLTLLKNNPHVIQKYEDVRNVAEIKL